MKKLLRLTVAALMLATAQVSTAQIKMAPNYFKADPAIYKYRMAQVVEWKDTEDEQITKYTYNKQGCLVKEEYKKGEGPAIYAYNYTYDQQGYMIQKEEVALKTNNNVPIVSSRHTFKRNEYGYVTEYTRATHHTTEPDEITLTEDVIMDFVYNDKMRLDHVDIRQFDYPTDKIEEKVGRVCKVEYNDAGLVSCVSQIYPDNNELVWKEEFTYDEKGRRISIKKVPGPNYTSQQTLTWTWHYDDDGDIDIHSSSNGFSKEFKYDKEKLASETFMPLEATEAEWALQGPLNCTLFKELPMEKYFKHAPVSETTEESEIIYEAVGTPDNISNATTTQKLLKAQVNGNRLTVEMPAELVGKTLNIFNAAGTCADSYTAKQMQTTIDLSNFAPGMYILSIDNQAVKFVK